MHGQRCFRVGRGRGRRIELWPNRFGGCGICRGIRSGEHRQSRRFGFRGSFGFRLGFVGVKRNFDRLRFGRFSRRRKNRIGKRIPSRRYGCVGFGRRGGGRGFFGEYIQIGTRRAFGFGRTRGDQNRQLRRSGRRIAGLLNRRSRGGRSRERRRDFLHPGRGFGGSQPRTGTSSGIFRQRQGRWDNVLFLRKGIAFGRLGSRLELGRRLEKRLGRFFRFGSGLGRRRGIFFRPRGSPRLEFRP